MKDFKQSQVILSDSSKSYTKTIFKAYRKTNKAFFCNFFFYRQKYEMNIIKIRKESSEKKHTKDIKIYLKERKKKGEKKTWERNQNLTEEEKEKKRQYRCENNKNLSKKQKQKLVQYMRLLVRK